jgi:thioredoxin reductase (NADPH)
VTIIHRRNDFRAHGDNVKRLKTNKVNVILNYIPKNIKKNILTIQSNVNNTNKTIYFDKLIVQYGQSIKQDITNLFPNIKTVNGNRIEVSINQKTNVRNIFAVGDICFYPDKLNSLICAHGEAVVAIRSIINSLRQYDKK